MLFVGVALWLVYGVLRADLVIVGANGLSLLMLGGILYCKLAEMARGRRKAKSR